MEIPRHVHKNGGLGQGGESRIVSTEAELDAAVADGWVVDPNAKTWTVSAEEGERADRASSDFLYGVTVVDTPPEAPPDAPIPDVLDDPDGAPPEEPLDSTEVDDAFVHPDSAPPVKRKPGRPRKS